jgi:hypothetical protein
VRRRRSKCCQLEQFNVALQREEEKEEKEEKEERKLELFSATLIKREGKISPNLFLPSFLCQQTLGGDGGD